MRSDRGSISLELAICAPVLVGMLALVGIFGRTAMATSHVDGAAFSAARAASIEREASQAQPAAETAAREYLDQQGMSCEDVTVTVDTSGFATPVGTPGQVSVDVSCRVPLSDLAALVPTNDRTFTGEAVSPIDRYRGR
ncbi:TadE/TadG family type IV pilus assembly protein [Janibacter sp. YB324]|uniref:TadE/TadG family type IV pilus assembly protein n=1 Tax=Janibacter TaxID=53457 RepID=UPI00162892CF|nr:TadE/TadG family type IV pilus assembly protein [Janibacter sp. YB324]QNF93322.1 pilus assembly protein [Janibacter sp. YB324]